MLNQMSDSVDSHLPVPSYLGKYLIYPGLSSLTCKTSQLDSDLQVAFYLYM